jgi:glycosyltransferase involved in cell wall biosynthesis
MASGTPVVTSNVSSLPEVAGDAAVLVDPYDPQSIADGIWAVLTDEHLRRELRHKGLSRARQFSWEASVRRVRDIYQEVAHGSEPGSPRSTASEPPEALAGASAAPERAAHP